MQEPASDPLAHVGLATLAAAVRRRVKQVVWARIAPYSLTPQQFWVLLVLHEKGPSSLHPLAQQVWMDDPTASRVVKALVGRGLLRTQPDPKHGRRIQITLTPEAMPLVRELHDLALEIRGAVVRGLSDDEQAVVRKGLRAMVANLDSMLEDPSARELADTATEDR